MPIFDYLGYTRPTLTDVFETAESFVQEYLDADIPATISEESAKTLYYLLYSKYGNNAIRGTDVKRFQYGVFSRIYMYGPSWEKRLALQKKARELTDNELTQGDKAIHNSAYNPSDDQSTGTLEELNTLNGQTVTNYKHSKMAGIQMQWDMLVTDVTEPFLERFADLFTLVASPIGIWYGTEKE